MMTSHKRRVDWDTIVYVAANMISGVVIAFILYNMLITLHDELVWVRQHAIATAKND